MVTWQDVASLALGLPETTQEESKVGIRAWKVGKKAFVWERPLRKADWEALGDAAPEGPVLAAHVADTGVKEALCASEPDVYFTTPHFDGYAAVLVRLDVIGLDELRELIVEAWLERAPKRLVMDFLDSGEAQ